MAKAISLLSGGLDSTLATVVVRNMGVDVTAVSFITPFGCDTTDRSSCSRNALPAAKKFGFRLKLNNLGGAFFDIVKNPRHGHGKNMNPCIDCRILMLKEARLMMDMMGADFLVTGEVVGQRPMSQQKNTLRMIEKRAGVKGLVLRPLSGRLLPATVAEDRGLVRREDLLDFNGRSRKPQIALARQLGVTDYPAPAGGCLLTDPIYSRRLRRLLDERKDADFTDIQLLRAGRQFWTQSGAWIIVGRDESDNNNILSLKRPGDSLVRITGVGSPATLVRYASSTDDLRLAASISARYTRKRGKALVEALTEDGEVLTVTPMNGQQIDAYRVI